MCELKLSKDFSVQFSSFSPGLLFRRFQRSNHRVNFQVSGGACLGERFAASAAVVDSKLFKDADCGRLFQCDFANGLRGCGHFDLLEPNLQRSQVRHSDFGHSKHI